MALNSPAFISGLIAAETPPKQEVALAAKGFVSAFLNYLKFAQSNAIPINYGTCVSAQGVLQAGIMGAFSLASGPAVSTAMGAAIIAFFNSVPPVSNFFAGATAIAMLSPLTPYMTAISAPVPLQKPAKTAVAIAITAWMGSGVAVSFPPDIKAGVL